MPTPPVTIGDLDTTISALDAILEDMRKLNPGAVAAAEALIAEMSSAD